MSAGYLKLNSKAELSRFFLACSEQFNILRIELSSTKRDSKRYSKYTQELPYSLSSVQFIKLV